MITREEWLSRGVEVCRPIFIDAGFGVPPGVKAACGWPVRGGLSAKAKVLGQCWAAQCSKANVAEIWISPLLDDPVRVLDVLVHEVCHAVVGHEAKHGPKFRRCALAVGLEGKMTSTFAGPSLTMHLQEIARELGDYPHSALTPLPEIKKQSARMLKVTCPECGYLVRTTAKWLEIGVPQCCCGKQMEAEQPTEDK